MRIVVYENVQAVRQTWDPYPWQVSPGDIPDQPCVAVTWLAGDHTNAVVMAEIDDE